MSGWIRKRTPAEKKDEDPLRVEEREDLEADFRVQQIEEQGRQAEEQKLDLLLISGPDVVMHNPQEFLRMIREHK